MKQAIFTAALVTLSSLAYTHANAAAPNLNWQLDCRLIQGLEEAGPDGSFIKIIAIDSAEIVGTPEENGITPKSAEIHFTLPTAKGNFQLTGYASVIETALGPNFGDTVLIQSSLFLTTKPQDTVEITSTVGDSRRSEELSSDSFVSHTQVIRADESAYALSCAINRK